MPYMLSLLLISPCVQRRQVGPASCSTPEPGFWGYVVTCFCWKQFRIYLWEAVFSKYRSPGHLHQSPGVLDKIASFWLYRIPTDLDPTRDWEPWVAGEERGF